MPAQDGLRLDDQQGIAVLPHPCVGYVGYP